MTYIPNQQILRCIENIILVHLQYIMKINVLFIILTTPSLHFLFIGLDQYLYNSNCHKFEFIIKHGHGEIWKSRKGVSNLIVLSGRPTPTDIFSTKLLSWRRRSHCLPDRFPFNKKLDHLWAVLIIYFEKYSSFFVEQKVIYQGRNSF